MIKYLLIALGIWYIISVILMIRAYINAPILEDDLNGK